MPFNGTLARRLQTVWLTSERPGWAVPSVAKHALERSADGSGPGSMQLAADSTRLAGGVGSEAVGFGVLPALPRLLPAVVCEEARAGVSLSLGSYWPGGGARAHFCWAGAQVR